MAGQIIKRGESAWLVRVFLGRDPETGKRKYFSHVVHGTKKQAQAYLNGALRERDLGRFQEPTRVTVTEYLKRWMESAAAPKLRDRTFRDYAEIIKRYLRDSLGPIRLHQLTPLRIQNLYGELHDQNLAAATIRKVHVVLSSALDQAVRWGMLPYNPALSVELPRHKGGPRLQKMLVLTPEEASRFLAACVGNRWGALLSFALQTGARPSEYLALQWKDVDWNRGTVRIQRTLYRHRGGRGWSFEETKTACGQRSISLSDSQLAELKAHAERQAYEKHVFADNYTDLDLIFAGTTGQPLCNSNLLQTYLRPLLAEAGLNPKVTLYTLRHTHATLLLIAGVHPKVVAERLGHSSIKLTLDVYSHVMPGMQQSAIEKLDTLLRPTPSKGAAPGGNQPEKTT